MQRREHPWPAKAVLFLHVATARVKLWLRMDLTTETASKKRLFYSSLLWWQSVLINSHRWPMSKPLFQALRRGGRTDWVLQPPSAVFCSFCADIAQMRTWASLLYRERIDVFVVTYLQNYCNLCSPGLMEPALLVNSQNICPGSDLRQWSIWAVPLMSTELFQSGAVVKSCFASGVQQEHFTFIGSLVWGREIPCWTE